MQTNDYIISVLLDFLSMLDCLFDKGLSLAIPELVPFRLTNNVVDAFGVTGVEGVYRRCCEVALKVLRTNKEMLMSVLDSFVHDPLVEWKKHSGDHMNGAEGERENEDALRITGRIKERLSGVYNVKLEHERLHGLESGRTHSDSLALSIEGQVHRLIKEATSDENLSQAYLGWMPFM